MLADYQEALAQLLVEARLREQRREDPSELDATWTARGLELDTHERESLRHLDPEELERAAAGLIHKRVAAVRATLPHTARLWPALELRYRELLAEAPATVAHLDAALGPGPSELLRLRVPLCHALREDPLPPAWTADLLLLELARSCTGRDARARQLRCAYPVHRALEQLDAGWLSVALEPAPCSYLVEAQRLSWRPGEDAS